MDAQYYWPGAPSPVALSHLYRTGSGYHDPYHRYLPAYIRAGQALPSTLLPSRITTPPPPLSPPPPGSILTAIPWLIKELTGELFGLPVLDPHDPKATTPIVRPTTPLPPLPPSPRVQTVPVYFRPYYHGIVPTRLIMPSWSGQKILQGDRIRLRAPYTILRHTRPEVEMTDWYQNGRQRTEKVTRRKFWLSRNGTVSAAVSDPAAPSIANTVSWSEAPITAHLPSEDLPPIKMPILSENLLAKLV